MALLDENHTQNASASAWFEANVDSGWASNALTQNGWIRIIAHQPIRT